MKIGLVTDSTSDLPHDLVEKHAIEVVPAILVIDGQSYADGEGLTRQEFYTRLPEMKTSPTTAAPSAGDFAERFHKLINAGCERILSIHAAGQLTAILGAAGLAARDFGNRVTVHDSGSLTLGLGFQVLAAAEAIADGLGVEAVIAAIQSTRQRLRVGAALDTMEYLRRSGRVPNAVAALGGLLHIKPVIELRDGAVRPLSAARTTSQATERLSHFLRDFGPLERLAVLHTNAEQRARSFLGDLMSETRISLPRDILMLNVTPVIGTHLGPNGLGFAAVRV